MKRSALFLKRSKPFYKWDILLYSVLFAAISLTFLPLLLRPETPADNISFYFGDALVAEYTFGGNFTVKNGYEDLFTRDDNTVVFRYPNDRSQTNVIYINDQTKTVKISSSTCAGHDCENMQIDANGGLIYCAPHKLKIVASGGKFADPVTG